MIKDLRNNDYWNLVWLRFKDGDKEAFAIFYNQHIDKLYQYGLKFCDDEETIKDALLKSESLRQSILKKAFNGQLL